MDEQKIKAIVSKILQVLVEEKLTMAEAENILCFTNARLKDCQVGPAKLY